MSQLPSVNHPAHTAAAADAPVAEPSFEVQAQAFWTKNRNLIYVGFTVILLAWVGWWGWQVLTVAHETSVQEDYARAAGKPDRLTAFAETNAGHALAGVAYLQLADQRYEAADYQQAATLYNKAVGNLKNEALLGRARLGAAVSQVNGGDKAAGAAALKVIAADAALLKAVRSEANFHLATLAVEAGRADEARKFIEEITTLDQSGAWSQRAVMLLMSLPASAVVANPAAPSLTLPPAGK